MSTTRILPINTALLAALAASPLAGQVPIKVRADLLGRRLTPVEAGPAVTNLRAGPTATSIRLSWTCPAGASGYEVFATPTGGAPVKLTQTPIGPQCIQDLSLNIKPDPRFPAPTQPTYITSFTHTGLAPVVEFGYVVRALYPTGFTDSQILTARTSLWPAPAGFGASLSGRSATLRWNPASGPSGYLVFRRLEGQSAFQQIATLPPSGASYSDNTILPPGQHGYYVQGVTGEPSATATLALPAWPAPTLTAALSGRTANLTWNPIPGAPGYLVFRQSSGQSAFQQVTAAPVAMASFQEALPVGTHQYYVRAVGGDPSAAVSVVPGRPQNATASVYRGKPTVDFHWGGTDDASSITLMRASSAGGPFGLTPSITNAQKNGVRDEAAQVGATQYYKILAAYQSLVLESDVLTATIAPPPKGITNLLGTSPGPGTIKLTWTCDPEATGYSLLRGKGTEAMDWIRPAGSQIPLVITACEWTEANLWNGATYRYTIVGRYADRNTSTDAQVSVTIAP